MKKTDMKKWLIAAGVMTGLIVPVCLANTGGLKSLRGANDLDKTLDAAQVKPQSADGVKARNYVQQPPVIPHKIQNYKIDLTVNMCLACHSWKNAAGTGAVKISVTHFKDRDGNELDDVAPRRYFCVQCHVPQVNAQPLVVNKFAPVKSLQ